MGSWLAKSSKKSKKSSKKRPTIEHSTLDQGQEPPTAESLFKGSERLKGHANVSDGQEGSDRLDGRAKSPKVSAATTNDALSPRYSRAAEDLVVKAIYDYKKLRADELSFARNDQLLILADDDEDWWLARNLSGGEEGYVPVNYLAKPDDLTALDWYHGAISRLEAEARLLAPGQTVGSFLVRESEKATSGFVLSIRVFVENRGNAAQHYRINSMDDGDLYIKFNCCFTDLEELVEYYSQTEDGLLATLSQPCLKETPAMNSLGKDIWEVPRDSVHMDKLLGSGQFGEVWEGLCHNTRVAIKTLKEGSMEPKDFLAEANVMKTLRHERLVQLLAICSDQEPILIISELMCNGSLLEYLRKGDGKYLDEMQSVSIAAQVAAGMAYIESKNFIHRDLAARNVLVGKNNSVKVADFGLSRYVDEEEDDEIYISKPGNKMPIKWCAPESINFREFTIKSDVWSFGILLHEIFTKGTIPYPNMTNEAVKQLLTLGNRMKRSSEIPLPVYDVMLKCWAENKLDRHSFSYLKNRFENYEIENEMQYKEEENEAVIVDSR